MFLLNILLFGTILICIVLPIALLFKRCIIRRKCANRLKLQDDCMLLSIFHPYCTSGGGGERVLWTGVEALLQNHKNLIIFIYTNDSMCLSFPENVFSRIQKVLDITVSDIDRVRFVPLYSEILLRPSLYPYFTLAGQSLGSMVAALEALIRLPGDVYLDTTGFAFTMPIFAWLLGAKCGAYVHYPTVSSDMQNRLASRSPRTPYNNSELIRQNWVLTNVKRAYYALFKFAYGWAGSDFNCKLAAVNSSWTQRHVASLWGGRPFLLYPPCPRLTSGELMGNTRKPWIISIGQFRPEKNHELQLKAFDLFLKGLDGDSSGYRLVLIGGCRDVEDYTRMENLKKMVLQLGIPKSQVTFEVNAPSTTVKTYLGSSTINLHTMVDEHFGIGVVEGMMAGLVTVANRSGGPLTDIIGPAQAQPRVGSTIAIGDQRAPIPVGFLASTAQQYADVFRYVLLDAPADEIDKLRSAAIFRAQNLFSEEKFNEGWIKFIQRLGI